MTNKERLLSLLGFAPPPNSAEGALLDAGISEASAYDGGNVNQLKTIAIDLCKLLLSTADTSNTLTGFQMNYDRQAIKDRIAFLQEDLGISNKPVINTKKVW